MIVNGQQLLLAKPVEPMLAQKERDHGVSFGLAEAGYDIRIKQSVTLHPFKRFSIASTIERFQMPRTMVGVVHDKSTWARRGLSVFNTVIEPGWEGWLTLELVYHGWISLRIPAGAGIASLVSQHCRSGKVRGQVSGSARRTCSGDSAMKPPVFAAVAMLVTLFILLLALAYPACDYPERYVIRDNAIVCGTGPWWR